MLVSAKSPDDFEMSSECAMHLDLGFALSVCELDLLNRDIFAAADFSHALNSLARQILNELGLTTHGFVASFYADFDCQTNH